MSRIISSTITGSASRRLTYLFVLTFPAIGPPPISSTLPPSPIIERVFEHATKSGHIVTTFSISHLTTGVMGRIRCLCHYYHDLLSYDRSNPKGIFR